MQQRDDRIRNAQHSQMFLSWFLPDVPSRYFYTSEPQKRHVVTCQLLDKTTKQGHRLLSCTLMPQDSTQIECICVHGLVSLQTSHAGL